MRLDVWLDVACLFKTRSEAKKACAGGKVDVNGQGVKPHRDVTEGDEIEISRGFGRHQKVIVRGLAEKHMPKTEARLLYEDVTPKASPEEIELRQMARCGRTDKTGTVPVSNAEKRGLSPFSAISKYGHFSQDHGNGDCPRFQDRGNGDCPRFPYDAVVRLDVWLDVACLFKTRSEAKKACEGGKVDVNGQGVKPHRDIREGDEIEISRGFGRHQKVIVRALAEKHLPKAEARLLYEDVTPKPSPEEIELRNMARLATPFRRPGAGTPDKRERREIRKMKGRS